MEEELPFNPTPLEATEYQTDHSDWIPWSGLAPSELAPTDLAPSSAHHHGPYSFPDSPNASPTSTERVKTESQEAQQLYHLQLAGSQAAFLASTRMTHSVEDNERAQAFLSKGEDELSFESDSYDSDETISDLAVPGQDSRVPGEKQVVGPNLTKYDSKKKEDVFGPPLPKRNGPVNKTREAMREYLAQKNPNQSQRFATAARSNPSDFFAQPNTAGSYFYQLPPFQNRMTGPTENPLPKYEQLSYLPVAALPSHPHKRQKMTGTSVSSLKKFSKAPAKVVSGKEMVPAPATAPVEKPIKKSYDQVFDEFIRYTPSDDAATKAHDEFIRSFDEQEGRGNTKASSGVAGQKRKAVAFVESTKNVQDGVAIRQGNASTSTDLSLDAMDTDNAPIANPVGDTGAKSVPISKVAAFRPYPHVLAEQHGQTVAPIGGRHHFTPGQQSTKTLKASSSSGPVWKPGAERIATLSQAPVVDPKVQQDIGIGPKHASGYGPICGSENDVDVTGEKVKQRSEREKVWTFADFEEPNFGLSDEDRENMSDGELDAAILFPEMYEQYGSKSNPKNKGDGEGKGGKGKGKANP